MKSPLPFLLLALALAPSLPAQQKLADFRRVVVADQPSEIEKLAAEELAAYAGRIAGARLEVVPLARFAGGDDGLSFFVGEAAAGKALGLKLAPWKMEEHLLKTAPRGLALAGDDGPGDPWSMPTRAGTLLAVYTLLDDHLGVRWFWPGPFGEHVPSNPAAVVPALDVRATPKFMIRSISLGYGRYHTPAFREEERKWSRRSRLGWTRSAVFGHSWFDAFNLRNDESFKAHPDWFALVQGKRRPPQMCTTHPEVLQRMVERVLASKLHITNVSPSDGAGFCECDEQTKSEAHRKAGAPSCTSLDVPGYMTYDGKSLRLSDRMFTYANEIARRVREKNPEKAVGMFAYTYYNKPPVKLDHLEPNIYLSFVYQAMALRDPQALAEWHDSVDGWKKFGAKMVVREGWGNHYLLDLPWTSYDQVLANLSEAWKLGFIAGYGEGSKSFATQAPNQWAVVRMLWDPERDTAKTMDDFFASAYGPAAAEMKAYFETWNQALGENWPKRRKVMDAPGMPYVNVINSWDVVFPAEVVAKADARLKEAEAKAPKGEFADRVAFHRFGHDYSAGLLELLAIYRQLAESGLKLEAFVTPETPLPMEPSKREALLKRALELGEQRETMLLAHRDWAGPDEGLYAFANDAKIRQWHAAVKKELGNDKPTALTLETLTGAKPKPKPAAK
jgi:hypothetical protein